jgi:hypothetical protein
MKIATTGDRLANIETRAHALLVTPDHPHRLERLRGLRDALRDLRPDIVAEDDPEELRRADELAVSLNGVLRELGVAYTSQRVRVEDVDAAVRRTTRTSWVTDRERRAVDPYEGRSLGALVVRAAAVVAGAAIVTACAMVGTG